MKELILNAYEVMADDEYIAEYIGGYARYEPNNRLVIVVAKSRGQARSMVAREYDFEFTYPMSIKKIASNVQDMESRIYDYDEWQWESDRNEDADYTDPYGFTPSDYIELGQDY